MTPLELNAEMVAAVAAENAEAAVLGLTSGIGGASIHVSARWWLAQGWPVTESDGPRGLRYVHAERKQGPITWIACFLPEEIPAERFECAVCRRKG